jgi:hypothetical protein
MSGQRQVSDHTLSPALRSVLDARGSNIEQARLIFNAATDDIDSLVEEIAALPVSDDLKRRLLHYCHDLLALNNDEGEHERYAAGVLDATLTTLRDDARPRGEDGRYNPGQRSQFTVKALARTLRPALAVIAQVPAAEAKAFINAVRTVDHVLDLVPAHQLLTPSVRNQLGAGRYRLLEDLVSERTAA